MSSSDDGPLTRTVLPEDEQGGTARRPRPLRSLLIVLGVVALLLAAIAVANRGGGGAADGNSGNADGTGPEGRTNPTAPTGVAPVTGSRGGIAKGFAHTEQGAQSAAANFAVALGSDGMFKKAQRHTLVDSVFTPQAAAPLKAQQDQAYSTDFLKKVGLDAEGNAPSGMNFISRTVPVGTKADAYQADTATVSVWCTGLIGMAGTGSENPVRTDWLTYTFELRWTDGDWKTVKASQKKGPAPVDGDVPVSGAEEIAGAVKEFGGFTYAR
ncbi:hypothetical protein [Wenjunlia tyrosinilytica]|uniref:DUF8175 domain-containing protein n=1 Tax=Wenjunlia tyrosinilytica TaxID=1544741 RepID=A0A918DW91_9ACTN|nr:hypothetical protein [Wenjunlia tyrosinilytica]GGO87366.1 hypothetical protein GCM10012280_25690 [Wenjunlia tyrosinilytica]